MDLKGEPRTIPPYSRNGVRSHRTRLEILPKSGTLQRYLLHALHFSSPTGSTRAWRSERNAVRGVMDPFVALRRADSNTRAALLSIALSTRSLTELCIVDRIGPKRS